VRTCPDGDHDGRVARGYLFNCLQHAEPVLRIRGSSRATLSQKVGVGAQVTRGGPGAAPSREAGAGAAGACGDPRAAPSREVRAVVLT
jgi:hypothetical protein